jgi:hypothetical protein
LQRQGLASAGFTTDLVAVNNFPKLAVISAALAGLLGASSAAAQETIRTGPEGAPPAAEAPAALGDPEQSPEAIGAWARGVLSGAPSAEAARAAAPAKGCQPPPDRKPHGEVWGAVGTHGYRSYGGVVTQPIGDCGEVTLAIGRTEGGFTARRR